MAFGSRWYMNLSARGASDFVGYSLCTMAADRPYDPFSKVFDQVFEIGPEPGNLAFFGRDVLRGLTDGIDEFVALTQERWGRRRYHVIGPVLLGCSPWITDRDLIDAIRKLSGACIVLSKRPKSPGDTLAWQHLRRVNNETRGVPASAFPILGGMLPKEDGKPVVVGPWDKLEDESVLLSTFRTIGRRKLSGPGNPPIAHAKLALLGHLWWADEDSLGYPADVLGFRPLRLWISSANFTLPSRRSLEFGFWTEDEALLDGAKTFLSQLMASSEELDAFSDAPEPELASVQFDDAAFADYFREFGGWDDEEDE